MSVRGVPNGGSRTLNGLPLRKRQVLRCVRRGVSLAASPSGDGQLRVAATPSREVWRMSFDERMTEMEDDRDSPHGSSNRLNSTPVPMAVVREVASGLKSLAKVLPYEEYAGVVYRIARVRWQCQLAASAPHDD